MYACLHVEHTQRYIYVNDRYIIYTIRSSRGELREYSRADIKRRSTAANAYWTTPQQRYREQKNAQNGSHSLQSYMMIVYQSKL